VLDQHGPHYFVDLAANDARLLSNTYALEQYHGWQGLCIEPNPLYWYNLSHVRKGCHIVAAVIGNQSRVYFRHEAGDHGGIADAGFDNGKRWQKNSLVEDTVPLATVLDRYQAPSVIDYWSLDVEGAESMVLAQFPFDRYRFRIITAERILRKIAIRQRLEQYGYHFIARLSHFGETLWIHDHEYNLLLSRPVDSLAAPRNGTDTRNIIEILKGAIQDRKRAQREQLEEQASVMATA
jgi:Methyltransferase FkbM domain